MAVYMWAIWWWFAAIGATRIAWLTRPLGQPEGAWWFYAFSVVAVGLILVVSVTESTKDALDELRSARRLRKWARERNKK